MDFTDYPPTNRFQSTLPRPLVSDAGWKNRGARDVPSEVGEIWDFSSQGVDGGLCRQPALIQSPSAKSARTREGVAHERHPPVRRSNCLPVHRNLLKRSRYQLCSCFDWRAFLINSLARGASRLISVPIGLQDATQALEKVSRGRSRHLQAPSCTR